MLLCRVWGQCHCGPNREGEVSTEINQQNEHKEQS